MSLNSNNRSVHALTIPNASAILDCSENRAYLIDVREPKEFQEVHYPYAINLPYSKIDIENFNQFKNKSIYLICHSGNRAKRVAELLGANGFSDLSILETQMEQISSRFPPMKSGTKIWSIDRQFRFTLGILLLIFLIGFSFVSTFFLTIPVILCLGLIITAIIDKCYMRMGIAMLPWNKGVK